MAAAVYLLCALTMAACAVLLIARYLRFRARLLLWSGICFLFLTFSNVFLFLDLVIYPDMDLNLWRLSTAAVAMVFMVYGLVWESEQ